MNRIISIEEPRSLIEIDPGLWISEYFINRGLVTPDAIFKVCSRSEYQIAELLSEGNSEALGLQYRRWNIDGHYFTVFEDGTSYNSDELKKLGGSEIDKNTHLAKKVMSGEIIDVSAAEKKEVNQELIF